MILKRIYRKIRCLVKEPNPTDYFKMVPYMLPEEHSYEELFASNVEQLPDTEKGFCFPWALAISNRKAGRTKRKWVNLDEWLRLRKISRTTLDGSTTWTNVLRYFLERGHDIEIIDINLDQINSIHYIANALNSGHEAFLIVEMIDTEFYYGHIECVVGVQDLCVLTNSWGKLQYSFPEDGVFRHWITREIQAKRVKNNILIVRK